MYSDDMSEFIGWHFEELPQWVQAVARVVRPGTLVSADVQHSRLNVYLNGTDHVTLIYWG